MTTEQWHRILRDSAREVERAEEVLNEARYARNARMCAAYKAGLSCRTIGLSIGTSHNQAWRVVA